MCMWHAIHTQRHARAHTKCLNLSPGMMINLTCQFSWIKDAQIHDKTFLGVSVRVFGGKRVKLVEWKDLCSLLWAHSIQFKVGVDWTKGEGGTGETTQLPSSCCKAWWSELGAQHSCKSCLWLKASVTLKQGRVSTGNVKTDRSLS